MNIDFNNEFKGFLSNSATYLYLLTKLEAEGLFKDDINQKDKIKNTLAFILEKQIVFLEALPKRRNMLMKENILEVIPNNSEAVNEFVNKYKEEIPTQVKCVIQTTNSAIGNFTFEQSIRKEISAWKQYIKMDNTLKLKTNQEYSIKKKI